MNGFSVFGQFVQTLRVCVQQIRHVIDESAGTACADSIHSLLDGAAEIGDFGIFAAELDRGIGIGNDTSDRCRGGDDFLDKRQPQRLGDADAGGSGQHHRHQLLLQYAVCFADDVLQRRRDIGKMSRVLLKDDAAVFVENDDFDCGGTDVDSDSQAASHTIKLSSE